MKKNTIRVDDIWNEKVPLKNIHVVEDTIIDIDDKLKKCEEALERAELGIGYDESLLKKFGDAIEDRNTVYNFTWQLTTWIHDNIDAPFKNDFDTYAWSPLSDIDYRKYEIDNDIGVTTKNSHPNAQGIIIEKKKLNLKDFLGSENEDKKSDSKNCEQVGDFAKIFKEQYKNLSKTMSEGDAKVELPDMRKFWDPESKTADERFKEFLSMVADATIIVPIADAILGKDIITGEKLSAYGVTSKILIAVIDVITLGIGSLSNPAVSGVIKEYALGLGAATVSAAVYEVADASGLPPAVINALTIGAGIVTVIIGNKVLFKNKAGKVLATKDIDELKNPRVRGNEAPPLRNELDDYLDDVGDFYENDVFGHYYDEWPELDDYFDELARHSEDIDVGSVSKSGSKTFKFSDMTESEIVKIVERYRKKAPIEIPDTAKYKAKSMADGYEQISYKWNDGTYKYEVRWHTRTSGAPEGQGNTWVIQRTIPGNGGKKPSTQFLVGENEWVEGWKWYDAISARKSGTATQEQIELLDKGHWKE